MARKYTVFKEGWKQVILLNNILIYHTRFCFFASICTLDYKIRILLIPEFQETTQYSPVDYWIEQTVFQDTKDYD